MAPLDLDRREVVGGLLATAALLPSRLAQAAQETPAPDVVEVSGTDRKAMVKAALGALGGIGAFVRKGQRVVLKPNLAFANPVAWATATHPDTLTAVAEACFEAGAKEVLVVENPLADPAKCLERTGAKAVLAALPELKLRMLADEDEFRQLPIPGGVSLKSTAVAKAILDADVFINLPQAKHHASALVSLGLKNAMGTIWSRKPFHLWLDLDQAIADLGHVVRPHLTILDATQVLLSGGPKGPGDVAQVGRMVAGRTTASVDAWGLTLTPFGGKRLTPAEVKYLGYAAKAGLGEVEVAKLKAVRVTA
jgi:uncharacterized protein (DUF362 family)